MGTRNEKLADYFIRTAGIAALKFGPLIRDAVGVHCPTGHVLICCERSRHTLPAVSVFSRMVEAHDCPIAARLIRRVKPAQRMLGDKGYDSAELRDELDERGTKPLIPNRSNRKHPFRFNKRLYKLRWRIEAAFNRLKDFRRIATRYDRSRSSSPNSAATSLRLSTRSIASARPKYSAASSMRTFTCTGSVLSRARRSACSALSRRSEA